MTVTNDGAHVIGWRSHDQNVVQTADLTLVEFGNIQCHLCHKAPTSEGGEGGEGGREEQEGGGGERGAKTIAIHPWQQQHLTCCGQVRWV